MRGEDFNRCVCGHPWDWHGPGKDCMCGGCMWFRLAGDGAKERVVKRNRLRKEAAEHGRLLPAEYREHLRRQFERDAAEATFIVTGLFTTPTEEVRRG